MFTLTFQKMLRNTERDPKKSCMNFSQMALSETNESNPLLMLETYLSI